MRPMPADVEVERNPGLTVVRFPREVDVANAAAIREEMLRLLNNGAPALLVDLTGTSFLDSAGLHAIVRAHLRSECLSVPMCVVIPRAGSVYRIFEITALPRLVPTTTNLASARALLTTDPVPGSPAPTGAGS